MLGIQNKVKELAGCHPENIPADVLSSTEPLLLKGLVADWPIVQAASASAEQALSYVQRFYQGKQITASVGGPEIKGQLFYNEDFTGFNFERGPADFVQFCGELVRHQHDKEPPTLYMGSTLVDRWLPGFRGENDLILPVDEPLVSIWMGNRSRVSAHYDIPTNIACCVTGKRCFTVFPPEQLDNLYVGPLDFTVSGVPLSLVDFDNPDYDAFPRFREALGAAQIAELEPGDAIFIPSMWWHHVSGIDSINVLINYWWRGEPLYMGSPRDVLQHALMSIRGLPQEQRKAWQHIFEYYVFDPPEGNLDHIPEHARGPLVGVDDKSARRIRALLLNNLKQ